MTAATRKASERARRKADGQVEYKGWLSASDHAALTQMARDSGMTQTQVVSRLIGMVRAVRGLPRWDTCDYAATFGKYIRHSDLAEAMRL